MPTLFTLTESDAKLLQDMMDRERRRVAGTRGRPTPDFDDNSAPDVYVARTPIAGIPAASGLTPGSVECTIYQLVNGTFEALSLTQTVNNLGSSAVGGSLLIAVIRDKFGTWCVSGQAACANSIAVSETDLRCEGTLLNLYQRTITISQLATGCLSKVTGTYEFVRTVACCDPSCLEAGTGTGTGPSECPCVIGDDLCLHFTNVSGCSCIDNQNLDLPRFGELNQWSSGYESVGCSVNIAAAVYCLDNGTMVAKLFGLDEFGATTFIAGADLTVVSCSPLHLRGTITFDAWAIAHGAPCSLGSTVQIDVYDGPCPGDTGTGTGTGGSSSGITMVGLGSATSGGSAVSSLTMSSITVEPGILVVNVNANSSSPMGPTTFNGSLMTLVWNQAQAGNPSDGNQPLSTAQFMIAVASTTTGDIVTNNGVGTAAMQMNAVNNIGVSAIDSIVTTFAGYNTTPATTPSTGTSAPSTAANEAVNAVVGAIAISTPVSWSGSPTFTSGGQDVTDNIGGFDMVLSEGRKIASAISTFNAALNGSHTSFCWNAGLSSYQ